MHLLLSLQHFNLSNCSNSSYQSLHFTKQITTVKSFTPLYYRLLAWYCTNILQWVSWSPLVEFLALSCCCYSNRFGPNISPTRRYNNINKNKTLLHGSLHFLMGLITHKLCLVILSLSLSLFSTLNKILFLLFLCFLSLSFAYSQLILGGIAVMILGNLIGLTYSRTEVSIQWQHPPLLHTSFHFSICSFLSFLDEQNILTILFPPRTTW